MKQDGILCRLREQIVQGRFPPGSRLPTRTQLERRFGASRVTVQRVMDRLVQEGFACVNGRAGTYVNPQSPHLCRYGLLFPAHPSNDLSQWPRFWQVLHNEATTLCRNSPRSIEFFYGVDGHVDTDDFRRLHAEVEAHHLAGLIFATNVWFVDDPKVLGDPHIARVALSRHASKGTPAVTLSAGSFYERAISHLVSCGRTRIAAMMLDRADETTAVFGDLLAKRGLESPPYWTVLTSAHCPEAARNWVHLLMHSAQALRPDGLIIADDNLVEPAMTGLMAAGISMGQELDVVAHCNYPMSSPQTLPIRRLGYDIPRLLTECLGSIDRQRRGQKAGRVEMPAVFEDELDLAKLSATDPQSVPLQTHGAAPRLAYT